MRRTINARMIGPKMPASHRRANQTAGAPPSRACQAKIRPAAEAQNRNPAAEPNHVFTRSSGSIDMVGAVRYQCPKSIPAVAPPIRRAVAISETIIKPPSGVTSTCHDTDDRSKIAVEKSATAKMQNDPARRRPSFQTTEPTKHTPASTPHKTRAKLPGRIGAERDGSAKGLIATAAKTLSANASSI